MQKMKTVHKSIIENELGTVSHAVIRTEILEAILLLHQHRQLRGMTIMQVYRAFCCFSRNLTLLKKLELT